MKQTLYFAYGSALDQGASGWHAGDRAMNATLRGYRLASAATLVADKQAVVPGKLYPMPDADLERLDDAAWVRTRRSVRADDGRRCKAWVYLRPVASIGPRGVM
jgi:gamma-glutamylcyclotransferase (GGCT)/AIG2-like uncharacterized protein YtfP